MQPGRLTYNIPQPADFDRFYQIHADPQTNLFNPKGPMDLPVAREVFAELLADWQQHQFSSWTIRLQNTGAIIGFGGLSYRPYGEEIKLNLGYRFDKDYWGQGLATELSLHTIHYGFTHLQKDKIFALVRPQHIASIKVLEKCGMRLLTTLDDVPGKEHSLVYIIEK